MFKKILFPAVLLFAIAPCASVVAAEQANNCKLKGGSMVLLDAGVCVMEGGAAITASMTPVVAASLQLSGDPKLAAAQRAVAELLIKPVVDKDVKKRIPEEVERSVRFDGCRLMVDENMSIDHGRFISARKNFKVSSVINLRDISRGVFGVLGEVTSYGGGMRAYAVFVEERKQSEGNNISIAMLAQRAGSAVKYSLSVSGAYWDAPQADFWMADEYGYPKGDREDGAATDKVRVLFFMNTADDAAALKKALDDVQALCKP